MANVVGSLFVELNLNSAQFADGVNKANATTKQLGDGLKKFGEQSNYSMMEARHGVMLLGEEMGVRIPRAVSTLIASIGPVGNIFASAFPILGAIALIDVIGKVIEHFDKAAEQALKFSVQEQDVQNKANFAAQALEVQNLKLQDEIDKIRGGAPKNTLLEQILELNVKTGELADNLSKADESMLKLTSTPGILENLKTSFLALGDTSGKFNENQLKVEESIKKVNTAIEARRAATAELATAPTDQMTAAQNAFNKSVRDESTAVAQAIGSLNSYGQKTSQNKELLHGLQDELIALSDVEKKEAAEATRVQLEKEKAAAEYNKTVIEQMVRTTAEIKKLDTETAKYEDDLNKLFSAESVKVMKDQVAQNHQLDEEIKQISKDTDTYLASFQKLAEAQSKLATDQQLAAFKQQEDAIKKQAAERVITQQEANTQLAAVYKQEEEVAVAADNQKLAMLKANIDSYQAALVEAQKSGDLEQINALRALLNQELAMYTDTEDKILKIKEQYGARRNAEDTKTASENEKIVEGAINQVTTKFADMVATGKVNFKSLFDSLEADILKTLTSKALNDLIGKLFGAVTGEGSEGGAGGTVGGGSSGGGIFSFLGGIFGGGKAEGGPVAPGVAYLVGEEGQEMFVPHTPGTIVPNSATIPSTPLHANVNIHVHGATDPDTFRKASPQIAADMYRHLQIAHAHAGRG